METPDYFGLKHGSQPRVPRPVPPTYDQAPTAPPGPLRWQLPVGLALALVSWIVGVWFGAPVLGRRLDTLFLALGLIGLVTGVLLTRSGWSSHTRRLRAVLLATTVVLAVSFSWGAHITVVIGDRPLPAYTAAGQAYTEAARMLTDLDRLRSYTALLELSPEQASSAFWKIEEAAASAEGIELRWAETAGRSPQWAAASDALRSSGYWMVEALRAKRDLVLESSAGRAEELGVAAVNFRQAALTAESAIFTAAALPPLSARPEDFPRSR
jgi:hypothetical protein